MLHLLLTALLLLEAPAEPRVTVLDNGLTVITQELHYAPVAATAISYRVGSRNESDGIRGISHFCEHMMFKGTPGMPKGRFWQIVQRDGGWANAFTSNDVTVYYLMLPASRLVDALEIESDRMANCLFDSAEVVSERNVIAEEWRMSSVDEADGALFEALAATAFTVHPYRYPVIGFEGDILSYSRESALAYYRAYYNPANAVLSVVGDFETEDLLEQIEDCFGGIPRPPHTMPAAYVEPPQTEQRRVAIEHESNLARIAIAFHTPEGSHPDSPILSLISAHLSGGRSSRLQAALVETGLASDVGAWNDGGIDPGLFTFYATVMPGVEPCEVERVIWEEIGRLSTEPIPDSVLASLKRRFRAGMVLGESSPLGLAMRYSMDETCFGDHQASEKALERMESATPEDIARVASEYFSPSNSTVAVLNPVGGGFGGVTRDRQRTPVDMEEPSAIDYEGLDIPAELLQPSETSVSDGVESFILDNGLLLLVKEDHTFPVAAVAFGIPLGGMRVPVEQAGLAGVATDMMLRGTDDLEYAEFHERLESRGARLRLYPGREFSTGAVTVLSQDLEIALESVAGLLTGPAFRASDFERVMDEQRAALSQRSESVFSRAGEALSLVAHENPAEARVVTEETLDAIDLDDARNFWRLCCRPSGSMLVVVGDVRVERVEELARELLGGWRDPSEPIPPLSVPAVSAAACDTVVPMPGRSQAAVFAGVPAPGYASEDYAAFQVMNGILGSGIGSRLGHYVRDDQGLAYYVGSRLAADRTQGMFTAMLSTKSDYAARAAESVYDECMRIAGEDVLPIELELEQASWVAGSALSQAGYDDQADILVSNMMRGFPADFDRAFQELVLALDTDDIRAVAEKYFTKDNWFFAYAGGLDENLEPMEGQP